MSHLARVPTCQPSSPAPSWRLLVKQRTLFVVSMAAYIAVLEWCYIAAVSPIWTYLGLEYSAPSWRLRLAFSGAALLPALWIPLRLRRASELLYLCLYVMVYVPACFVPVFRLGDDSPDLGHALQIVAITCAAMLLLGLIYRIPIRPFSRPRVPDRPMIAAMIAVVLAACAVLAVSFGSGMHLAQLSEVSDQRLAGRDVLEGSSLRGLLMYCMNIPANVVNPFLFALGITRKRWGLVAFAIAGQFFVYSAMAARSALGTVVMAVIIALLLRNRRVPFAVQFVGLLTALVGLLTVISLHSSRFNAAVITMGIQRYFISSGYATQVYYEYFLNHPVTHFSQVSGFGWLANNPYPGTSIGFVIGESLGNPLNQINANLWADGFACLGATGAIITTIVAAFSLHFMDRLLARVETGLVVLTLTAQIGNILDLPIFTMMLGGGLAMTALLLYLTPRREKSARPAMRARIGGRLEA